MNIVLWEVTGSACFNVSFRMFQQQGKMLSNISSMIIFGTLETYILIYLRCIDCVTEVVLRVILAMIRTSDLRFVSVAFQRCNTRDGIDAMFGLSHVPAPHYKSGKPTSCQNLRPSV